jgi:hypothetical protein
LVWGHSAKKSGRRKALWKLPQLWKASKDACGDIFQAAFHQLLGKAYAKTAPAFPQFPQRRRRRSL